MQLLGVFFQIAIALKRENKTLASHPFHMSPTKYTRRYNSEVLHRMLFDPMDPAFCALMQLQKAKLQQDQMFQGDTG